MRASTPRTGSPDHPTTNQSELLYSDLSEMRRTAIDTAASAKAANTTLLTRTMTIEAESNAGGEINACQAYAKRAPAASARICLSPQPGATRPPCDGDHRRRFDHQEGQSWHHVSQHSMKQREQAESVKACIQIYARLGCIHRGAQRFRTRLLIGAVLKTR